MTDIFAQEGITFETAHMASTSPSANPEPIPAPDLHLPPDPTVQPVSVSELQTPLSKQGAIPAPPAPAQIAANLAGNGNSGVSATAGAAPPQPSADFTDIFDKEGISAPAGGGDFSRGVVINPHTEDPEIQKVSQYAAQQQQQTHMLASQRFTPAQMTEFSNNPVSISEAIKNQQDWPDVPVLLQKQAAGEQLDDAQHNRLNEYIDVVLKTGMRGMSWGGNTAAVAPQLPAQAVNYVNEGNSGKLSIDQPEAFQANLNGNKVVPAPYSPQVGEKPLNEFMAVTDKGSHVMAASDEKPAIAALQAATYPSVKTASNPLGNKTPMYTSVDDLPASLRSALFDEYKKQEPKAALSNVESPSGWTKMLNSLGEDVVSKIMVQTLILGNKVVAARDAAIEAGKEELQSPDPMDVGAQTTPGGMLTASAVDMGNLVLNKIPGAAVSAASAAADVFSPALGRDVSLMAESEMGRVGESEALHQGAEAAGQYKARIRQVQDYLDMLKGGNTDQMMVDSGVVSVDGAKSTATKAAEKILTIKGSGEPVSVNVVDGLNGYSVQKDGDPIGHINTRDIRDGSNYGVPNTQAIQVNTSRLDENFRGQGYASSAYRQIANIAISQGKELWSDSTVSPEAQRIYQSLSQHGYKVIQQLSDTKSDGSLVTASDGMPVYRVVDAPDVSASAKETVANMTANEKEQFVHQAIDTPRGTYPETKAPDAEEHADEMPSREPMGVAQTQMEDGKQVSSLDRDITGSDTDIQYSLEAESADTEALNKKEPPPINDEESGYNWVAQKWDLFRRSWDDTIKPIQNLVEAAQKAGYEFKAGEAPDLLARLYSTLGARIKHFRDKETFNWNEDGSTTVTGRGLKSVVDDFHNLTKDIEPKWQERNKDFDDYLAANRYMELDSIGKDQAKPHQVEWATGRLKELATKYGDKLHLIDNLARDVYGYIDRVNDNMVRSGVISAEKRDALKKESPRYVPLTRVFEAADKQRYLYAAKIIEVDKKGIVNAVERKYAERIMTKLHEKYGEDFQTILANQKSKDPTFRVTTRGFTGAGKGAIKKLVGSNRQARPILQNLFDMTQDRLDRSAKNQVAMMYDRLKEIVPELIQDTKPLTKESGTVKFTHYYDPKLRDKLDKAAEFFGTEVKRGEAKDIGLKRGVIGSYSPMEDLIRQRLGSTEGVQAHELGHAMDTKLKLQELLLSDPAIKKELQELAMDRLNGEHELDKTDEGIRFKEKRQDAGDKYTKYIRSNPEVIANFVDSYINMREQVREKAPKATEAFEAMLDDNPQLAFVKDLHPSTNRGSEVIEKTARVEADELPAYTIEVYKNGQRKLLRLAKPLYEASVEMGYVRMSYLERTLGGALRTSKDVLRWSATHTPDFILRNAFKDQMDAMIQGGVAYNPITDFTRGMFQAFGHGDMYDAWVRAGGKMDLMEVGDKNIEKAYKEWIKPKGRFAKIMHGALEASEGVEHATRIGAFIAAKRKGLSDLEAAHASLDATVNFSRGGKLSKAVNRYVPFFNAGVQGTSKLIRTAKQNPKATLMWGLGTVTIPQVLLTGHYLYGADEETRNEYLEIPMWQKDMFYVWKDEGGTWRSLPKPFSWGYVFGSIPQRIMLWDYARSNPNAPASKEMWQQMGKGLFGVMSPINDWSSTFPPAVKAALEWQSNYNWFLDKSIYPNWMNDLPPEQRFTTNTSETAKELGKLMGVSPAKVENTIRDQGAGVSGYGLRASDALINQVKKWNGEDVSEKPLGPKDNIFTSGMTLNKPVGFNSISVQEFFDNFNQVKQAKQGQKNVSDDELEKYQADHQHELDNYDTMNSVHEQIAKLQKQANAIRKDTQMSGAEKQQELDKINQDMTVAARDANMIFNQKDEAVK